MGRSCVVSRSVGPSVEAVRRPTWGSPLGLEDRLLQAPGQDLGNSAVDCACGVGEGDLRAKQVKTCPLGGEDDDARLGARRLRGDGDMWSRIRRARQEQRE